MFFKILLYVAAESVACTSYRQISTAYPKIVKLIINKAIVQLFSYIKFIYKDKMQQEKNQSLRHAS